MLTLEKCPGDFFISRQVGVDSWRQGRWVHGAPQSQKFVFHRIYTRSQHFELFFNNFSLAPPNQNQIGIKAKKSKDKLTCTRIKSPNGKSFGFVAQDAIFRRGRWLLKRAKNSKFPREKEASRKYSGHLKKRKNLRLR